MSDEVPTVEDAAGVPTVAVAPPPEEQAQELPTNQPQVEELLVEEISIDGMCGVY